MGLKGILGIHKDREVISRYLDLPFTRLGAEPR